MSASLFLTPLLTLRAAEGDAPAATPTSEATPAQEAPAPIEPPTSPDGAAPVTPLPSKPPVSIRAPEAGRETPEPEHSPFEEPQLVTETLVLPGENTLPGPPSALRTYPPQAELPPVHLKDNTESPNRLRVIPIFQLQSTFDDNIFISKDNRQADVYHNVQAGLALGFGDFRDEMNALGTFQQGYEGLRSPDFEDRNYVFGSYSPGYQLFSDHTGESTFTQAAEVGLKWNFGKLATEFNGTFRRYSEAFVDLGTREKLSLINLEWANKYAFSEKLSFEADLYQFTRLFDNKDRVDSSEWIDQNYLNYQLFPKTSVAAGLRLGYIEVDRGPSQKYEQAVLRVMYDSDRKINANVFAGVDFRQFGGGGGDSVNPVFGLMTSYTPTDNTTFTLNAAQQIVTSAGSVGNNVISTGVSLGVTQRIFQKTYLTAQAGYEHREYDSTNGAGGVDRKDDVITATLEYTFHLTKWTALSLSYGFWRSDSTVDRLNFYDNRASIRFDVLF